MLSHRHFFSVHLSQLLWKLESQFEKKILNFGKFEVWFWILLNFFLVSCSELGLAFVFKFGGSMFVFLTVGLRFEIPRFGILHSFRIVSITNEMMRVYFFPSRQSL